MKILHSRFSSFRNAHDGATMIEFAILMPVFILLVVAVMEYGLYFLKSLSASRALGAGAQALMVDPQDPRNQAIINAAGGFGDYEICAQSYLDHGSAEGGDCIGTTFVTGAPTGATDDYYILLKASATTESVTQLFDEFLPDINERQVVKIDMCAEDSVRVVDASGAWQCKQAHAAQQCPSGEALAGFDANGDMICVPIQAGGVNCIEKPWVGLGVNSCDANEFEIPGVSVGGASHITGNVVCCSF